MEGVKTLHDTSDKFKKYLEFMRKKANIRQSRVRNSIDVPTKSKFFDMFEQSKSRSIQPVSTSVGENSKQEAISARRICIQSKARQIMNYRTIDGLKQNSFRDHHRIIKPIKTNNGMFSPTNHSKFNNSSTFSPTQLQDSIMSDDGTERKEYINVLMQEKLHNRIKCNTQRGQRFFDIRNQS